MAELASRHRPHRPEAPTPAHSMPAAAPLQALGDRLNNSSHVLTQRKLADTLNGPRANRTGLPDRAKAGIEALSGLSLDNVRVHYNSPAPAQLNAHAFTRGTDIHVAPGQERHVSHEAWHVVQQAQHRVVANISSPDGVPINDDPRLEHEADMMGARAASVSSGAAPPAQMAAAPRSGPLQLRPIAGVVTGLSHLVRLTGGGLTAPDPLDNEGAEVRDGEAITIDDERAHISRRGPNQEVHGHRDANGPAQYLWYHVLALGSGDVEPGQFVRADVVRIGGTTATPKLSEEQANLLDLPLPAVMARQKAYQDRLSHEGQTPGSLANTHRSVGFEFEFAKYGGEDLPSHVVLAESAAFSHLYRLPFVLETDSGSVLEIGFPPLLFRNRPGGGANTPAIGLIFNKAQTAMSQMGARVGLTISDLCGGLAAAGFGSGWSVKEGHEAIHTVDRSDVDKFAARGVYSQMNITLTSEESARLIDNMANTAPKGTAERSPLGKLYGQIITAMDGHSPPAAKIHMARAFANLAAAFDIARARHKLLPATGEDLASTVKELHGVWVKDVPANIVAPFAGEIDPQDVEAGRALCEAHLNEEFEKISEQDVDVRQSEINIRSALDRRAYQYIKDFLLEELHSLDPDRAHEFSILLDRMINEKDDIDFTDIDTSSSTAKPLLAKLVESARQMPGIIKKSVDHELQNLVAMLLHARLAVATDRAVFGNEQFGSGKGVRKDTHLPPVVDRTGRPVMSVAELRSTYVVNKFLETD